MGRKRSTHDTVAVYGRRHDRYMELVQKFPLRPIRTEDDLDAATVVIHGLIDQDRLAPPERDYLDVLTDLVEAYEAIHYPIEPATDGEMLRHLLEVRELTQAQLAKGAGIAESTVSEVLADKRKLTRTQIGKLAAFFGVRPQVLGFDG